MKIPYFLPGHNYVCEFIENTFLTINLSNWLSFWALNQSKLMTVSISFRGANMVQEEQAKYLGDQLSGLGLAESADATVKKRKGLVIMSIFEIRTVLEDCRSQVSGGLSAGIDIGEMAVIPMLLTPGKMYLTKQLKSWKNYRNCS